MELLKLGTYIQVNQQSLIDGVGTAINKLGHKFELDMRSRVRSHTKAGSQFEQRVQLIDANALAAKCNWFKFKVDVPVVVGRDNLYPLVVVRDSTFPGQSFLANIGIYRAICSNGLMSPIVQLPELRIRHTANNIDMFGQFEVWLGQALEIFLSKLDESVSKLTSTRVEAPQTTLHLVAAEAGLGKYVVKQLEHRINYPAYNRPEDNINTAWGLYNVINEVDRHSARTGSNAYMQRDIKLLESVLKYAA